MPDLDAGRVEFNNTNVPMARGDLHDGGEYNADEKGGGEQIRVYRRRRSKGPLVLISRRRIPAKGMKPISGAIEVVKTTTGIGITRIRKDYLTDGAVMSASQTTIITENGCNGGK